MDEGTMNSDSQSPELNAIERCMGLEEMVFEVVSKLSKLTDFVAFASYCRAWRSAVRSFGATHSRPPLIAIAPYAPGGKPFHLRSLESRPFPRVRSLLPTWVAGDCYILGCSHGHLIVVNKSLQRFLSVVNALTGYVIFHLFFAVKFNLWSYATLTAPPASEDCSLLLFTKNSFICCFLGPRSRARTTSSRETMRQIAAFCNLVRARRPVNVTCFVSRGGKGKWCEHRFPCLRHWFPGVRLRFPRLQLRLPCSAQLIGRCKLASSPAVASFIKFQGKFLAVNTRADLLFLELTPYLKMRKVRIGKSQVFRPFNLLEFGPQLVECDRNLLLILYVYTWWSSPTYKIEVYKLSFKKMAWVELQDLGDYCLFMDCGGRCPVSCPRPSKWGGRNNCVYVAGEAISYLMEYHLGERTWRALRMDGKKYLSERKPHEPFIYEDNIEVYCTPTWVYPSFFF